MFLALVGAILILLVCGVCRRLKLRSMATVWRQDSGLLHIELRRSTTMCSRADGRGGVSFPQPTETRILSWQFHELPLWSRTEIIGLPSGCEARLENIQAEEFDPHFAPTFQLSSGRVADTRHVRAKAARAQSSTASAI